MFRPLRRGRSRFAFRPQGLPLPTGVDATLTHKITLEGYVGCHLDVTIPAVPELLSAYVTEELPNGLDKVIPVPTIEAYVGGHADITVPSITITASVTSGWGDLAQLNAVIPVPTLEAVVTTIEQATLSRLIPVPTLEAYVGGIADLSIPVTTLESSVTTEGLIRLDAKIPIPVLTATVTTESLITVDAAIPVPVMLWGHLDAVIPVPVLSSAPLQSTFQVDKVYLTNLRLGETTRVSYPFLWLVRFNGEHLGFDQSSEYVISGTTDDGAQIASRVTLHPTAFGSQKMKRVSHLYMDTEDPIQVTTVVDLATQGTYVADHGKQRITLPRGSVGRNWQFVFENLNGKSMRLDGAEWLIDFLNRKS